MLRTLKPWMPIIYSALALVLILTFMSVMSYSTRDASVYTDSVYSSSSSPKHTHTPPPCIPVPLNSEEEEEGDYDEYEVDNKLPPTSNAALVLSLEQKFREQVLHVFDGVEAVVLMDHPEYKNRGDSALYMGEINFIRSLGLPIIYECSFHGMKKCDTDWINQILDRRTGLVCFSGGGNFGDIWPWLREAKETWLSALQDYKIFQFPQTVHFKNLDTARYSAALWAAHPSVTISVRDMASVNFMREYFPTTPVFFVPDAAFLLGPMKRYAPTYDMMWLMRQDKETAQINFSNYTNMTDYIKRLVPREDITINIDDWLNEDAPFLPSLGEQVMTRRAYVRTMDGLRILSAGKVVVSDRLHAHVLCTLADIPHVILDNENGKVFHVHEAWTPTAVHVRLATSLEDAMEKAVVLLREYEEREREKEVVKEVEGL